jgi:hypothetical protein
MDDGVHAMFGEQSVDQLAIAYIADHERHIAHRLAEAGG